MLDKHIAETRAFFDELEVEGQHKEMCGKVVLPNVGNKVEPNVQLFLVLKQRLERILVLEHHFDTVY